MILEIVTLEIKLGAESAFEVGAQRAAALFRDAKGCRSMKVHRSIENPQTYVLFVQWDTLEDHVDTFRSSPAYTQWRDIVGPCFAAPPDVQHVRMVVDNF